MLNIIAALSRGLVMLPHFVVDKSQTIGRTSDRSDGVIPTLTTSSDLFNFFDGGCLKPGEYLKLMGHDVERINLTGVSAAQLRNDLGMSVHIGVSGLILGGLIASIGSDAASHAA